MLNRKLFSSQVIKHQWFVISFIVLALMSCRELVQDEFPDFTPVPTVNSILIADSTIKIHVSLAAKLDSIPLKNVDQAEVQLFVDGTFKETLAPRGNGMYTSSCRVEPGKSYQCKVNIAGYDTVTCTDSLPLPASLLQIEHIRLALFSNEQIEGDSYTMVINYTTGHYGCQNDICETQLFPFVLELRSISYNYYQYLKQLYLYNTGRYPDFTGGVVSTFPLHSNVQNGYGIFAGYSSVVSDLINPE